MIFVRVQNEVISFWLPPDSHISRSLYNSLHSDLYMCFLPPRQHFPAPSRPFPNPHSAISGFIQGRSLLVSFAKETRKNNRKKRISPRELARPPGNHDLRPFSREHFSVSGELAPASDSHLRIKVERNYRSLKDERLAKCGAFVWLINSRCAVGL